MTTHDQNSPDTPDQVATGASDQNPPEASDQSPPEASDENPPEASNPVPSDAPEPTKTTVFEYSSFIDRLRILLPFLLLPFKALRWLIHLVFGELFWRSPRWMDTVGRGACTAVSIVRSHKRQAIWIVAALAALGGGWAWWAMQPIPPEPVKVTVSVKNPNRTNLEDDDPAVYPLRISFSAPVAALDSVDKEVEKGNITIMPPLKGKWNWDGDSKLSFQPEGDWPVGGEYAVTFSPRMFRPEALFESYKTTFQTPVFEARSLSARFNQDPTDSKDKTVVASINFTHPVDSGDFEKRVSMVIEGQKKGLFSSDDQKVDFKVRFDKKKLNAFIQSEQLIAPSKAQTMRVTVDKGVRTTAGGNATSGVLTATATIPGLDSLKVSSLKPVVATNDKYQMEQVLMLEMSMLTGEKAAKDAVQVWLLPERLPKDSPLRERFLPEYRNNNLKYYWDNKDIEHIDSELLKHGEALKLEALPTENDVAATFSYRYQAPQGRYIYVKVPKGLTAFGGFYLDKDVERIFQVPAFAPIAQIMSKGSLLPLSGERKVTVIARDVPAVQYSIARVLPEQLQYLVNRGMRDSGSFSVPSLISEHYSYYNRIEESDVAERFEKTIGLSSPEPGKPQYQALDLNEYLKMRRGVFLLRVQGYNPETKETVGGSDNRLVMVSDLGLIEKQSVDGSHDLFVQSIFSGGPVSDALVEIIGRNGLPVLQARTDAGGRVTFPKLNDFKNEREPVFFKVSKEGDSSFLPYSTYDQFNRKLNYSRFDVGGAVNAVEMRQLSAYLFSDRGIYRPGEEIRVGMLVRAANWTKSVAGIPLELEVIDARGLTVRRDKITMSESGFGELRHPTLDTAPAGTYTINLSLVKDGRADTQIGSTTVRVQDFEPDRLRMTARFSAGQTDGWVSPDDLAVEVSLQNLFATPAENRRIRGFLSLSPGVLRFSGYKDYLFDDPQQAKQPVSEELNETTTDEEGKATLKLDLNRFDRVTYRAHVVVQGFEADGGRGVSAETATLVSGLDYLVGYKPDGNLSFVRRDSARTVNLLAIGRDGKQRAVEGLKIKRIERRYVSILTQQNDGTYRYQSTAKDIPVEEPKPLAMTAVGVALKLATDTPGSFTYIVTDASDLEYARISYSVAGEANLARSLDKNAELTLTLSKGDFVPGEEIEVQIEAPYTGSGLITIERDRVYAHRWFTTRTNSTMQKIRLPEDVDGNAYLTVTFVRDPGSDEIYMSPLSYGVVPFSVSRERYQLPLDVAALDKIKPGETASFKVTSTKPAKAVVFAVDEGILQVARYKTADPLGYFFQKRALEVSTSQLLDLILPEFSRLMASAPGGDAEAAMGRFLNPFKRKRDPAVAYWSGIVDVGPGGTTLSWQVPEYFNGKLRVMAVAVTPQAVGVYEGQTIVRGDFVLLPNAPLTVTPGDEFDMSVGVSNNLESSGNNAKVKVTLDPGKHFEVLGDKTVDAPIPANREGVVHFRVRVKPELGSGTLALTAGIGSRKTSLATTVSIRPATPHRQDLQVGTVSIGKSVEIPTTRRMFTEHRKFNVDVSASPLVVNSGLVSYLGGFPYSCTEQLVSKAIPALVLSHRPEFGELKKEKDATLVGLIATLRGRQNAEGSYGLWAANSYVSEAASVWVQQFLVEAKERGEVVPADMLQRGNDWLRSFASSEGHSLDADRVRAQAAYILTRQGIRTSDLVSAIQKRLEKRDAKTWKNDLAAVYLAVAYKMLQQDRLADGALSGFRFSSAEEKSKADGRNDPLGGFRNSERWLYDDLRRDASALHLLAKHIPERAKKLPEGVFTSMLDALSKSQNTSFSSGQLLLALDAWTSLAETSSGAKFRVDEILAGQTIRERALSSGVVQRTSFTQEAVKVAVRNQGDMMGFYVVETSGFDIEPPTDALREGAEILREYKDASGKPVTSVAQGDEVYVHLKFRGLNNSFSGINMAFVDLLPGGFDLVLNPPRDEANSNESQRTLRRDTTSESESRYDEEDYRENEEDSPGWSVPFGNSPTRWFVQYADMREDRIVLYGELNTATHEFVYKIRATNVGTYTLPPAYAEGLYRRDVRAFSLPGKILTVVAPEKK
ncbi:MAG: alpha-2-macroglobulin [Betaproteobacteria bacterium]|nr:alpha-2-macroglobulin [Betaproteobacteria bacterium]